MRGSWRLVATTWTYSHASFFPHQPSLVIWVNTRMPTRQHARSLVCRLFAEGTPVFRYALSPNELAAWSLLGSAIKTATINQQFALCPYCNLHRGQVVADGKGGRLYQCPECGPIQLEPQDMATVTLNEDWLRQKLRMAMEINSRDGIDQVGPGVWRLGDARQGPVILTHNLSSLVHAPATLDALRVNASRLRVITPKPIDQTIHPFAADIDCGMSVQVLVD